MQTAWRSAALALALLVGQTFVSGQTKISDSHKRALLIGINDYTASRLGPPQAPGTLPDRDWPNLSGAVNDVKAMEEMLVLLYGFDRRDILTLTDQAATRQAILAALEQHVVNPAAKDDVLLFYYGGHGSQVRNSLSDERDKLDESIIPADSRLGARDIRDKELRPLFNRVLDRGAHLTVILDNCYSGSGARGLPTGAHPRGVRPDLRDVADRATSPRPETRGALVLSAAQDFDTAWETRDSDGAFHGAFSWALMRAMRDSAAGEPALETFLRTQARLRAETPFQEPVIAGTMESKRAPLLGSRRDRRDEHTVVAVEKVQSDGTVILQGGWAAGLTAGTELSVVESDIRLTITAIRGLGLSEARVQPPGAPIHSGALAEVVAWAAPPIEPLRVWTPRLDKRLKDVAAFARLVASQAAQRGVRWVADPLGAPLTHLLRRQNNEWELLAPDGDVEHLQSESAAIAAVAKMPAGSSLFVQFPAPASLVNAMNIDHQGVVAADRPEDADYILVGRFSSRHLSYAWLRPLVMRSDRRKSGLPLQTAWIAERKHDDDLRNLIPKLRQAISRLRTIHAWHLLESPPGQRYPFELAIRRTEDRQLITHATVYGQERYELVLKPRAMPLPPKIPVRYVYAFAVDSSGKSTLLFPLADSGSVENRFSLTSSSTEIPLGKESTFEIGPPYGIDTYFLLTTDEPLPNPSILEWDSVRSPAHPATPLEQLLALTAAGTRSIPLPTPTAWSIDKLVVEATRPHATNRHRSVSFHKTFSPVAP